MSKKLHTPFIDTSGDNFSITSTFSLSTSNTLCDTFPSLILDLSPHILLGPYQDSVNTLQMNYQKKKNHP